MHKTTVTRELVTLPIAALHLARLSKAGFVTAQDVLEVQPLQLSKETGLSQEDALGIIQAVREHVEGRKAVARVKTAAELLQNDAGRQAPQSNPAAQFVSTFCGQMDSMLRGGIPLGVLTEFCGAPGIGKTQLGIQLALNVQLPVEFGGADGDALYIDTEGSFIIERVLEIADGTVAKLATAGGASVTRESLLSRIHYVRVHDHVQLIALAHTLDDFVKLHPKLRIVIVDSIAFHFRHDFSDMALRTRLLNAMAQSFGRVARETPLSVVLMNQMTTKVSGKDSGMLVPALGESWGHASTHRIILFWQVGIRHAKLYKSNSMKETTIKYDITADGVRDHVPSTRKRAREEGDSDDRDETNM